jgi:hypothetical protein
MFYCEVTPADVTTATSTAVQWWLGMEPPKEASGFKVLPIQGAPMPVSSRRQKAGYDTASVEGEGR